MDNNNAVLIQYATLADIERMIDKAVEKRMQEFYERVRQTPDPLVRRKDAARRMGVSLPTIDNYAKYGLLNPLHKGGRVFFRESELQQFMYESNKL